MSRASPKDRPRGRGLFFVALGAVGLAGIGALLVSREASAKDPDEEEEDVFEAEVVPLPNLPQLPEAQGKPWPDSLPPFTEEYSASAGRCSVPIAGQPNYGDGQPYNEAAFPGPLAVVRALRYLGYDAPAFAGDDAASTWLKTKPEVVGIFQKNAIFSGLPGLSGAPAKMVDRMVGVCTLRALGAAVVRRREGTWSRP